MIGITLGGRYTILEELGGGGMAVVYKGRDTLLNRPVSVKVLREQFCSDEDFVRRFHREAQAVASLSHPNIVSIYDVGKDGNRHYLVMEYIEGETLKERIQREAPLPLWQAVEITGQICDALQHAHEHGVVHRDIKPQNILLTREGRVKVTDFGIAQAANAATLTYEGSMLGSVHYVSPEQAKGEQVGPRSDIYSAGVVLFEMLTGALPFSGDTAISVALKHVQLEPPPPRTLRPDIPPRLERVVLQALAKRPADRYATALEMKRDLERVRWAAAEADAPTQVLPLLEEEEWDEMGGTGRRRRPRYWAWAVLAVLLVAAAAGGLWWAGRYLVGQEVEVPPVEGLPLAEAQARLLQVGLPSRVGERLNDPRVPEGYVIRQSIPPHRVVKKGRQQVVLDVSLGPLRVPLPDVVGRPEREAVVDLENAGFRVATPREEIFHEQPPGTVVRQEPAGRSLQPQGSEVRLWLSKGPEPRPVTMVDLTGLPVEEATARLEELKLRVGLQTYQRSNDFFAGQVISQSVPAGQSVLQGSEVNLVLSSGPGPPPRNAIVSGLQIPRDGRQHRVRIVVNDRKGTREEYNRLHDPGEVVETSVTFYGQGKLMLYLDYDLIKEKALP